MIHHVFVTESTTKAFNIKKLLEGSALIPPDDTFTVIPTKGRIYDLDPVSPDDFSDNPMISWSPIDSDHVGYLKSNLSIADALYFATDPDSEGELIAWQLANLADISLSSNVRVHLSSLTPDGISAALDKISPIDTEKAQSAISRRVIDNFALYSIDPNNPSFRQLKGLSGRVVSPLLASIAENPLEEHCLVFDKNVYGLKIEVMVGGGQSCSEIESEINDLGPPILDVEEDLRGITGLTFDRALNFLSSSLGLEPDSIAGDLQSLYEEGRVTYPRTDSGLIHSDQKREFCSNFNSSYGKNIKVKDIDDGLFNKDSVLSQEGHGAIIPLEERGYFSSVHRLSSKESVFNKLWDYWLDQVSRKNEIELSGNLNKKAFENKAWRRLSKKYGVSIRFTSNPEIGRALSPTQSVFRRMSQIGIGRPSTSVGHSLKIAKKFGFQSERVSKSVGKIRIINPKIIDVKKSIDVNQDLLSPHSKDSAYSKVMDASMRLGFINRDSRLDPSINRNENNDRSRSFLMESSFSGP